jgi:hypothetical protein
MEPDSTGRVVSRTSPMPPNRRIVSVEEMLKIDPNYRPRSGPPKRPSAKQRQVLLDAVPEPNCAVREAAEMVRSELEKILERRMSEADFMLEDSDEAMAIFIERAIKLFVSALIQDGAMLGQICASAESCVLTQATLKTKKTVTGAASIRLQGALRHLTSLLHAQETPIDKNMAVHFLRKVTKRQVIDLTKEFVGVTVKDLMGSNEVQIGKVSREISLDGISDDLPYNTCYDVYLSRPTRENYQSSSYCLRITFDKQMLFTHQLTPYKIAAILRGHSEIDMSTRIIPSSFSDAFIDVYTTSNTTSLNNQQADLHYIICKKVLSVSVQGIPEIKRLAPDSVEYHTLFKNLRGNFLEYDLMTMANHNYPSTNMVEDSLKKAGIKILKTWTNERTKRIYAYTIDTDIFLSSKGIKKRIDATKYADLLFSGGPNQIEYDNASSLYEGVNFDKVEKKLAELGFVINETIYEEDGVTPIGYNIDEVRTNLVEALQSLDPIDSEYVYAVLEGSNIQAVSQYPWVDTSRLTTNSIPIMFRLFGLEVARNYFIYDYSANKARIDANAQSRYTFIIADDMTCWGEPFGISFYGNAKKKDNDWVTMSTISHPVQTYVEGASRKMVASSRTNPASILTSGQIAAGTKKYE